MSRDDFDDESQWVPAQDYEEAKEEPAKRGEVRINFGGGEVVGNTFQIGTLHGGSIGPVHTGAGDQKNSENLAEQRQRFFFDFLKESLKQVEWTFRLSVCFMAGGATVILAGAVLALVHTGNPDISYLPLVTALTGALITVGGGALAIHARRARAHLTKQAERLDVKIDADHRLEKATGFIDRINDPTARDRLNSAAAMKALDMQAGPDAMVDRLLPKPEDRPDEIGPGDTVR